MKRRVSHGRCCGPQQVHGRLREGLRRESWAAQRYHCRALWGSMQESTRLVGARVALESSLLRPCWQHLPATTPPWVSHLHDAPTQHSTLRTLQRDDSEERQAGRAAGPVGGGGARRNVVRINLRQQTVKPRYSELSDDEEMQERQGGAAHAAAAAPPPANVAIAAWGQQSAAAAQPAAWQQAQPQQPVAHQPAAAPSWQQQLAKPAAAAVAQEQAAAAAAVTQAWQPAAVPDWAAHLPASAPSPEPAPAAAPQAPIQPPWMKHMHRVSSASALAASTKQASPRRAGGRTGAALWLPACCRARRSGLCSTGPARRGLHADPLAKSDDMERKSHQCASC